MDNELPATRASIQGQAQNGDAINTYIHIFGFILSLTARKLNVAKVI